VKPMPKVRDELIEKYGKIVRYHPDWDVRNEAISGLSRSRSPLAVPHLVRALRDKSETNRETAAHALGNIGDLKAVPHLVRRLKDSSDSVKARAAGALLWMAGKTEGVEVEGKSAKAFQLIAQHIGWQDSPDTIRKAYRAALEGKINEKNARLYVKQLRAMEGSLK